MHAVFFNVLLSLLLLLLKKALIKVTLSQIRCRGILTLLRKHSPDGTTRTTRHTSDIAYYSIYRPQKDERLSWPSWLTYSGRLTHISGHPSAAGRAWDRKVRRSKTNVLTTVPCNQSKACMGLIHEQINELNGERKPKSRAT